MQRPLDPHRFKENRYERPGQDWICGHAAEGHACPLGPDARGKCRHTGECFPARKEDRWFCMRSDAAGGKCAEGPLPDGKCAHPIPPCQPVASVRKSRGAYVWLAVALTAGLLLIALGPHFRRGWTDPGTLTNAHATSAATCSDCHSLDPATSMQLVSTSFKQRARNDSALCLKCHQLGAQPLRPHGLPLAQLTELRSKLPSPNKSSHKPILLGLDRVAARNPNDQTDLACATCHQEHHGRNFDLTRLADAQCQSCHSVQFASFEHGHPEFSGYPSQRRTRIFFDHKSHFGEHFAAMKDKAPGDCQSCHVPGGGGRFMQVKSFNNTCAACHSAQIKGEGMTVKGVPFFTVPGIDAETLADKGISIGEWPKFADGRITPFMELLLSREPKMRAVSEKLRGVDLLDLTKATPEQLSAAEEFAWGVKTLLFNLAVQGQSYLLKEMKGEVEAAGLEVPRATLLAAQTEWMPHLLAEMADYKKGIKPPLPETAKPAPSVAPSPPNENPAAGDESLLGGEDLTAVPEPSPAKPAATPGDDLLAGGNDDLTATAASPTPKPSPAESDDLTGGDLVSADLAATATPPPLPSAAPSPMAMPAEDWSAAGGWYRPQGSFTLYYRPIGHADPFLVAWLTAAAKLQNKNATDNEHAAFQALTDPQNAGLCMKCHTADRSHGLTTVNWLPAQPNSKSRPFTTFNHTTHFSLVGDTGCQKCHVLNRTAEYAKFFAPQSPAVAGHDPLKFQSNFAPISRMQCAECHQPRIAGDSCMLCHRYHAGRAVGEIADVGRFRIPLSKNPEPQKEAAE